MKNPRNQRQISKKINEIDAKSAENQRNRRQITKNLTESTPNHQKVNEINTKSLKSNKFTTQIHAKSPKSAKFSTQIDAKSIQIAPRDYQKLDFWRNSKFFIFEVSGLVSHLIEMGVSLCIEWDSRRRNR